MKGYIFLSLTILFGVCGTSLTKITNGFTLLVPTILVFVCHIISFYFFALCLNSLPLSLAYAIWSGIGTALVAVVGVAIFSEKLGFTKIIAIILIMIGTHVLNKSQSINRKVV